MRLAFVPLTIMTALGLATTARAADLDGPLYEERDRVVIERPAPPRVVERERIIEHHYYEPRAEVYVAPPRYYAPRAYAPYAYAYDGGYRAAYEGYGPRPFWRHRHHPGW